MGLKGYIKLQRTIQESWIWNDYRFKWWLIILLNVNHAQTKVSVANIIYDCRPGQSFRSIENWATLMGCAKSTVDKFFDLLQRDDMIKRETIGKGKRRKHLLTVVNWTKYQAKGNGKETVNERKLIPNNNENNDNKLFEHFWDLYDKKIGKQKCIKLWQKLSKDEIEKIMVHFPKYVESTQEKQFRMHPSTYLNGKCWNDEIISIAPKESKQEKINRQLLKP
ncbi:hypothetical protein [Maribellus mangrovi]|uniref:hypothetical protein n=1 Tax=Maribellus mangrovi TaxID=3133146 RepID=UPI0030EEFE78